MGSHVHRKLTQESRDQVALYVLGGMRADEVARFREHLDSCQVCHREVTRLEPVATDLLLGAPDAEPPIGLRDRVLARVRLKDPTLLLGNVRAWQAADVPGVEFSQLWVDHENRRHTILIRIAAGASLPAHRHGGPEECYVIEGDLLDGDLAMAAGDYVRYDAGSEHTLATNDGCLLLVSASLQDRRIEPTQPEN
jgi:quercetin dioxygenase-like cupin family protein